MGFNITERWGVFAEDGRQLRYREQPLKAVVIGVFAVAKREGKEVRREGGVEGTLREEVKAVSGREEIAYRVGKDVLVVRKLR